MGRIGDFGKCNSNLEDHVLLQEQSVTLNDRDGEEKNGIFLEGPGTDGAAISNLGGRKCGNAR